MSRLNGIGDYSYMGKVTYYRVSHLNGIGDYSYMGKVTLLQGVSFKWYRRLQLHG